MKQMDYDILVVGSGPAGLSAAQTAAKNGIKVGVIEKRREIGYPVHTSGGSFADELKKLGIPEKFMHPIHQMEFRSKNYSISFKYKGFKGCVLDIRNMYQYLAERASLEGAEIFVDATAESPIVENNFVCGSVVKIHDELVKIRAKVVIDASGINSIIARKTGLVGNFEAFGYGAEYDLFAPRWNQDEVLFILDSSVAPNGYGWIFPRGNERVRVGVGIINAEERIPALPYLKRMIEKNNKYGQLLGEYSEIEYHEGLIPIRGVLPKTVSNGLIVVGDAAGQMLATTGEGIRFALAIGKIAGKVAMEAVKKGDFSEKFLYNYEKEWRNKYEKRFKIGYKINKLIRNYSDEQWDRNVKMLEKLDPDTFLEFLKGNFSARNVINAIKGNPYLLKNSIMSILFR